MGAVRIVRGGAGRWLVAAAALLAISLLGGLAWAGRASANDHHASANGHTTSAAGHRVGRATGYRQNCPEPFPARRDPSNPLDLPSPPGPNPLTGARFFVPGPARGPAAGAIAQLLGLDAQSMPLDESWASFDRELTTGPYASRLAADPALAHQVLELSKIAAEPDAQRISIYSEGGGPGAIFGQTEKIFCSNLQADPGSIPIFNTYFLHAALGGCATTAQIRAYWPRFRRYVDEMAAAIDRRPAVLLLEIDALGSSRCMAQHGSLHAWEMDLRYEANRLGALPHTVVYVEAGYSDGNPVGYTARALNAIGLRHIRGFFTNDTHLNWTINEVRWATAISRRTHGAHFIVDTADNGQGPLRPRNRVKNGNEDLCNPPGRGLGPMDTTDTGFRYADAFMWTHPPGNSSGCGGGPPGGVFWPARAIGLAERANARLGPGYPSQPY
ncbi:MAG: glycoside hydrolase family 6 protein [Solirubrobacteraceae bacterium]